jgi:sugar/nucleoside kinase (ribokinase family)
MEPTHIFAGRLQRDILLPVFGPPLIDVPGGKLLYAAAGFLLWGKGAGLLARAGEDYPREWLSLFEDYGLDTQGIKILPEEIDLRNFLAYTDNFTRQQTNPVAHFARLGIPFPKILLGYRPLQPVQSLKVEVDISQPRPADIPSDYLHARCVHLCGLDYSITSRMISAFRESQVRTLTLDPQTCWMQPIYWKEVCLLLNGLTAFLPSEKELRSLFWGKSNDLVEMAEAIAAEGCEFVVVKRGPQGQLLYDGISHKIWQIPAYNVDMRDPTGAGDSFCGGFLGGYHNTNDPLQAVLHGNISASLTIEGSGVFHILESHPGLAKMRLDSLKERVREL